MIKIYTYTFVDYKCAFNIKMTLRFTVMMTDFLKFCLSYTYIVMFFRGSYDLLGGIGHPDKHQPC